MIKIWAVLFFCWTVVDRLTTTFKGKAFARKKVSIGAKLNSLVMIAAYVGIAVDGLIAALSRPSPLPIFPVALGSVIYLTARYLRNNTIQALGTQWNLHTSAVPIARILTIGPFPYTRHPYYSATVLELIAYAFLFGSFRTGVLTILVFLPLMIFRIGIEEKNLKEKFPKAYTQYQREVGVLFDLPRYFKNLSVIQDIIQIAGIVKRFGIRQLSRIRFMSHAVMRYSRGYAVSRIAGAMIEVGLIERLLKERQVNLIRFASEKNLDFDTLKTVSDYFSVLGIFEKERLDYRFTSYGKKLFDVSRGIFTLLYAYMPVFEELPAIIQKQKEYGIDIFRKSEFVGRGSAELAQLLPFPYAKDILRRHHLLKILDLGCGAGDFLATFCKDNGFSGYGVDISPEVISVARRNASSYGVSSRVKFQVADLRSLNGLEKEFKDVDVITFMFVLHEFLEKGPEEVVHILKEIRQNFPDKYVLVNEVCRWGIQKLIKHPVPVAEHHLFHKLSRQGLATVKEWKSIFRKAGFACIEERRFDRAAQAYFLLKAET